MSDPNISTNMSLPIPVTGTTPGPNWANDYNSCLTLIDAHDHSPGNGVQITPAGLNISSDLSFSNNSITTLLKASFSSQSGALSGTNFLSFVSGNLYVNDGSGNQIPITSGGGVAGSPGSIGSLSAPASATYVAGSKLFQWQADSGKAAAMDNGAVTIRETNVASAKGVTLQSASGLASDYSLTLLSALPGSTQALNVTNAGVLSTISYDSIGSSMTSTGANAIAATRTRATGSSVAAGGVAISSSCGDFVKSTAGVVDVTNLSVSITTSGRPVYLCLINDNALFGYLSIGQTSGATATLTIYFNRAGSTIGQYVESVTAGSSGAIRIPGCAISFIDPVGAGTYTYKIQCDVTSGSAAIDGVKLCAFEL